MEFPSLSKTKILRRLACGVAVPRIPQARLEANYSWFGVLIYNTNGRHIRLFVKTDTTSSGYAANMHSHGGYREESR
jgi:hypothetical protein